MITLHIRDITPLVISKIKAQDILKIPYHNRLYYQLEIRLDLDRIVLWSTFTDNWYVVELLASWDWIQVQQFYRVSLWNDFEVLRNKLINRNRAFRPNHGMMFATYEPLFIFHNAYRILEAGRFLTGAGGDT